jgi:hypothetical protein
MAPRSFYVDVDDTLVELGIEACFQAFLPKPDALIDDVRVGEWRLTQLHPSECRGKSAGELIALLPSW